MNFYSASLFLVSLICVCNGYKILFMFHMPGKSHNILASKLVKEMSIRGYEVTFITPFPSKTPMKNVKEISIEIVHSVIPPLTTHSTLFNKVDTTPLEKAIYVSEFNYNASRAILGTKEIQNLLKSNEQYDAVLFYYYLNEALLPLAHHFKAPVILFASMPLYTSERFLLSHPTPSSYVPNMLTEYTGNMDFWQRLRNSFYDISMILYYQWVMLPKHRELVREYYPEKIDLDKYLNNESLLLVNSHVSTNGAVPVVPNTVEIGGFHIDDPKPLPEDLKKILDEAVNGVILFSMGTTTRGVHMQQQKQEALIKAFSKLKETVLWKFENKDVELPPNVKIMEWIPQSDVLAHPNVKAFISHGGLLSTMESVYHGIPIIGIPVYADQQMNIAIATSAGYAIELSYQDLSEETVSKSLDEILNNPKYKDNIKKRSKILKDRPIKPMDSALYWIEYVIRHAGAPHLRYPGMDLNWFQRNLLDVAAFAILVPLTILFVIVVVLKQICKSRKKQKYE